MLKNYAKDKRTSCKATICVVCEEKTVDILYHPCGHSCVCVSCHEDKFKQDVENLCMLCQTPVNSTTKLKFC